MTSDEQLLPRASQRCQVTVIETEEGDQVPAFAVTAFPIVGVPTMIGGVTFVGVLFHGGRDA